MWSSGFSPATELIHPVFKHCSCSHSYQCPLGAGVNTRSGSRLNEAITLQTMVDRSQSERHTPFTSRRASFDACCNSGSLTPRAGASNAGLPSLALPLHLLGTQGKPGGLAPRSARTPRA